MPDGFTERELERRFTMIERRLDDNYFVRVPEYLIRQEAQERALRAIEGTMKWITRTVAVTLLAVLGNIIILLLSRAL